jgi:hypothetical protein
VTLYEPVCTCAVPGITGCAKHTWPTPRVLVPEDLPCDCNPGFHEPDCVHVTGYPTPEEPE